MLFVSLHIMILSHVHHPHHPAQLIPVRLIAMVTLPLPESPRLPDYDQQQLTLQMYGLAFLEQSDALAVLMKYLQLPLSVPSSYVIVYSEFPFFPFKNMIYFAVPRLFQGLIVFPPLCFPHAARLASSASAPCATISCSSCCSPCSAQSC